MSDPAIEAAHCAWDADNPDNPFPGRVTRYGYINAAREALKPIRELVENWDVCHEAQEMALLAALKPLIYATEELAR